MSDRRRSRRAAKTRARRRAQPAPSTLPPWTPFGECSVVRSPDEDAARYTAALLDRGCRIYRNSRYVVWSTPIDKPFPGGIHLSIKNVDRSARHDWRDFQRIKNEIVGPEREAIELYPPESQLLDTADQFHLWVLPPETRSPYGFREGRVVSEVVPPGVGSQRLFEPGAVPSDLVPNPDEVLAAYRAKIEDEGDPR